MSVRFLNWRLSPHVQQVHFISNEEREVKLKASNVQNCPPNNCIPRILDNIDERQQTNVQIGIHSEHQARGKRLFLFVCHLLEKQLKWPRATNRSSSVNIRIPAVCYVSLRYTCRICIRKGSCPKYWRNTFNRDSSRERDREELLGTDREGEDLT